MEHSAVATVSRPSLPRFLADHVAPAMLWILFTFLAIWGLVSELREDPSGIMVARNLLSTVFVGLMMVLFLLRYSPKGRRGRPAERLVAIGGTFVFFFLAFAGEPTKEAAVIAVGVGVDVLGLVISIVALATLGRCFGLFPEARGLVTRGLYRFVRHPLYFGEIVFGTGLLISVFSPVAFAVWAGWVLLQLWRAANEERALAAAFPEYVQYKQRTRRVIPFVW